jgi:hypothetical protein
MVGPEWSRIRRESERAMAAKDEWDDSAFTSTLAEEAATQIILQLGDKFKGTYHGSTKVTDPNKPADDPKATWWQHAFRAAPNQDGLDEGELCSIGGYAMDQTFGEGDKVPQGTKCRLECVKEVDMGTGKNPMKSIKISIIP